MTAEQLEQLRRAPVVGGNRLAAAFRITEQPQAACVRATGFTPQYVSDMTRGRYPNPSLLNMRAFATFFGCAIDDLWPAPDAALPFQTEVSEAVL